MARPGAERVEVDIIFLLYAFRYALGRRSYAVQDVAEVMMANVGKFTAHEQSLVAHEIAEALAQDRAGMDMDRRTWENVRSVFLR
jgi:hypothetical protein